MKPFPTETVLLHEPSTESPVVTRTLSESESGPLLNDNG